MIFLLACAAAEPPAATVFDPTFAAWDAVLVAHVQAGSFDYEGLRRDRAGFDAALANFAAPDRSTVDAWPKSRQLAFWIDVYNAQTIRTLLAHWPVESIKSIGLLPYAAFRERSFTLRARPEPLSLDDVEKRIVLAELHDPRAHMALNCASRSCPALASRAWSVREAAGELDVALDEASRSFLADPTKNTWDAETGTLRLSRIFDWYAADFGDIDGWIRRYGPATLVTAVSGPHRVEFREYDWSLNGP